MTVCYWVLCDPEAMIGADGHHAPCIDRLEQRLREPILAVPRGAFSSIKSQIRSS